MRSSIQKPAEAVLALAAAALLALLIIPWGQPVPHVAAAVTPQETSPAVGGGTNPQGLASPETISRMFVSRVVVPAAPAAPAAAPAAPAKKPVDAPWITYGGFEKTGEKYLYIFKDGKTGRNLRLFQGETVNGWSVVEVSDTQFILKCNDDLYIVKW
jgi:hypothetical protein